MVLRIVIAACGLASCILPVTLAAQPTLNQWTDTQLAQGQRELNLVPLTEMCDRAPSLVAEQARRLRVSVEPVALRTAFCASDQLAAYDALQAVKRIESAGLTTPPAWGLYLAVQSGNSTEAWPRLGALLTDPTIAISVSAGDMAVGPAIQMFSRNGMRAQLEDLFATAVQSGVINRLLDPDYRSGFAYTAMGSLAGRDPALAESLLSEITQPEAYISMLALRSHQAVWPALERRVGPGMADLLDARLASLEARMQASPDNAGLAASYVTTLRQFRMYDRAVAEAFRRTGWPTRLDDITQEQAWMLNQAAFSLDRLGREPEGDAIMDYLAELNPRRNPWVVNFAINRSERLANLGRSAEVMRVFAHDMRVASTFGSSYAHLNMVAVQICALTDLGRADEAANELDAIRRNQRASQTIAATAYLCLGREADAVRALSLALRDPNFHGYYAGMLQDPAFDIPVQSGRLPDARLLVRSNPDLQAQFNAFARFIPPEFAP